MKLKQAIWILLGAMSVLVACQDTSTPETKTNSATPNPQPQASTYLPDQFMDLSVDNRKTETDFYKGLQSTFQKKNTVMYLHTSDGQGVARADRFLKDGWEFRGQKAIRVDQKTDWGFKPGSDRNYTFMVNSMDYVEPLFLAYRDSKDEKYLKAALDMHLDWYDYNVTQGKANEMKWYDMSTGLRGAQLSTLLAWMLESNYRDKKSLETIFKSTKLHLDNMSDPKMKGRGNHLFFQMKGIVAVCSNLPEFKLCDDKKKYAYDIFYEELSRQYKSDGMHVEHSPGYHFYVLNILKKMIVTNWYDARIQSTIETPLALTPWLFHPNGDMVIVGDSETNNPALFRDLHTNMQYFLSKGQSGTKPVGSSKAFKANRLCHFQERMG